MTLLTDNRTDIEISGEMIKTLEDVCLESLRYEEFEEDCEISLSFVTNEEIHEINRQFRNVDRPTDVLSFPQLTFEEGEEADVNEKGESRISYADYAIAMIDEIENANHIRQRFSVIGK